MKKFTPKIKKAFLYLHTCNVPYAVIKDIPQILKGRYEGDIDIIIPRRRRMYIRRMMVLDVGFKEHRLNFINNHMTFFDKGKKVFDVHVEKTLPSISLFKFGNMKYIKKNNINVLTPEWEVAILLLSALRGRGNRYKKYRLRRLTQLRKYIGDVGIST